jgi:hypothetical protein
MFSVRSKLRRKGLPCFVHKYQVMAGHAVLKVKDRQRRRHCFFKQSGNTSFQRKQHGTLQRPQ